MGWRIGYACLHSAVDGYSRLAHTESPSDEKASSATTLMHSASLVRNDGSTRIERIVTTTVPATEPTPSLRLQDRHTLHMMSHRKRIALHTSRKRPAQRHFPGSLCNLRAPRASNERHGGQSAQLRAEHIAATRSLRGIRPARELHGPPQGDVEPPLHLAWSGITSQLWPAWRTLVGQARVRTAPRNTERPLLSHEGGDTGRFSGQELSSAISRRRSLYSEWPRT